MKIPPFPILQLLLASIISSFVAFPLSVFSQDRNMNRPFPEIKIPDHASGPEMIEALGAKLPEVARWHGMTADEFRDLVNHDHSLKADSTGRLYFACETLPAEGSTIPVENSSFTEAVTEAEVFALASRPGAPLTILLDFDGHSTKGTPWNRSFGKNIQTPAYSIDGDFRNFSPTELQRIAWIWKQVADDFAPWDVNVTTVDPGSDDLSFSGDGDERYGIRVCIGGSGLDWYGGDVGGAAYLGSFKAATDTPCFVFPSQLWGGDQKLVAEAISHEVGHTFFLYHDGQFFGRK